MESVTFQRVQALIETGDVRVSAHGHEELAADGILVREVLAGTPDAVVVEDYPEYHKGPSVLVLIYDPTDYPIHVVWGIPKGKLEPAVLVTAYRPHPERWSADFKHRMP